ncbi:unnamed protein product [Closterium sp. NIES-54]
MCVHMCCSGAWRVLHTNPDTSKRLPETNPKDCLADSSIAHVTRCYRLCLSSIRNAALTSTGLPHVARHVRVHPQIFPPFASGGFPQQLSSLPRTYRLASPPRRDPSYATRPHARRKRPRASSTNRPLALDSPKILSIAGASRWLSVAGGQTGLGMGTGGVRWRSAVSGAGGGGDDGSETDGQGGELLPAAVAVEGEASGGGVADAADACDCFFPLLTPLAPTSPPVARHDPSSPITHPPPGTLWTLLPIAPYLAAVQDVGAGRQRRRRQYGTYGDDLEEDVEGFEEPADEAHYRHLYDAHGVVDKWLGDPALWGMLSGRDDYTRGTSRKGRRREEHRFVRKVEASLRGCACSCHTGGTRCTLLSFSATVLTRCAKPQGIALAFYCAPPPPNSSRHSPTQLISFISPARSPLRRAPSAPFPSLRAFRNVSIRLPVAAHFPRHAPPRSPLAARPRGALRRPRARLPTSPSPPPPPPSSPPLSPEAEKVGEGDEGGGDGGGGGGSGRPVCAGSRGGARERGEAWKGGGKGKGEEDVTLYIQHWMIAPQCGASSACGSARSRRGCRHGAMGSTCRLPSAPPCRWVRVRGMATASGLRIAGGQHRWAGGEGREGWRGTILDPWQRREPLKVEATIRALALPFVYLASLGWNRGPSVASSHPFVPLLSLHHYYHHAPPCSTLPPSPSPSPSPLSLPSPPHTMTTGAAARSALHF